MEINELKEVKSCQTNMDMFVSFSVPLAVVATEWLHKPLCFTAHCIELSVFCSAMLIFQILFPFLFPVSNDSWIALSSGLHSCS